MRACLKNIFNFFKNLLKNVVNANNKSMKSLFIHYFTLQWNVFSKKYLNVLREKKYLQIYFSKNVYMYLQNVAVKL